LNHVAISVPDIKAAAKWYTEVLGFTQLKPFATIERSKMPNAAIFKIYPDDLQKVTTGCLSAGNGIGVELFEFQEPKITADTQANFAKDYKRGGLFHIGITVPDVDALCEKAVKAGAKKIGETVPVYEYDALYIEDPWGTVIELISGSFERIMSNRG
jgi:catechol 2,3-dioxygenase-like lactoylglutathione lyase family enzyme